MARKTLNNFWQRAITGVIFVVALVLSIISGERSLALVFGFAAIIGTSEFTRIIGRPARNTFQGGFAMLSTAVLYSLISAYALDLIALKYLAIWIPVVVLQISSELFSKKPAFIPLGLNLFGTVLVASSFGSIQLVAHVFGFYDYTIPLGFFIFLWINDTGAYLMGKWRGKTKLIPKISPGKTVEGFVGGVGLTLSAAFIASTFDTPLNRPDWMAMAIIVSIFSNFGDWTESMLKRTYEVKDSGRVLPGHGGILDRFDGVLLAMPMLLFYFLLRY